MTAAMCCLQDYVVAHLPKQVQAYLPKDVSAWLTKLMTLQRQSTGAGSATGSAVAAGRSACMHRMLQVATHPAAASYLFEQLQTCHKWVLLLSADDVVKGVADIVQNKAAEVVNAASDTAQGGMDAASQRTKVGSIKCPVPEQHAERVSVVMQS